MASITGASRRVWRCAIELVLDARDAKPLHNGVRDAVEREPSAARTGPTHGREQQLSAAAVDELDAAEVKDHSALMIFGVTQGVAELQRGCEVDLAGHGDAGRARGVGHCTGELLGGGDCGTRHASPRYGGCGRSQTPLLVSGLDPSPGVNALDVEATPVGRE